MIYFVSSKKHHDLFEEVKKAFDGETDPNWAKALRNISMVESLNDVSPNAKDGVLIPVDDDIALEGGELRKISNFCAHNADIPVVGVSSFDPYSASNGKHDPDSSKHEKKYAHIDEIMFLKAGGDIVRSIKQPKILVEAYKAAARRRHALPKFTEAQLRDKAMIKCGLLSLDIERQDLHYGDKSYRAWLENNPNAEKLTAREFKFLAELMKHPGHVKAHEFLAEKTGTYSADSTLAVRDYTKRTRKKLAPFLGVDVKNTPIKTLYGGGIIFNPDKIPPLDAGALEPVNEVADLSAPSV